MAAMIRLLAGLALVSSWLVGAAKASDYPTEDLADYVFACMASNGQTREALRRCSCSIDVIASLIPHDEYVQAQTILSLTQVPGENVAAVRDSPWTKKVIEELRRAQAEAEIRCF